MSIRRNNIRAWMYTLMLLVSAWCPARLSAGIIHQQEFSASDFDIYDMTAPNGDIYSKVSGSGMSGSGEIGHPELPYKVVRFLVPDNAYDFNVTVESMETAAPLVLDNTIYPVQKPIPTSPYSENVFTFPDEETYRSLKTTIRAEILDESRLEGRYHIVSVGLWPLAYSGNDKELEMCASMRINLDFKEKALLKQKSNSSNNAGFIDISDIVVNADAIQSATATPLDFEFVGSDIITALPRYYIISERALVPALQDLATWKTQKGYCVVTKAIEDIYEDSKYKVGTNGIVDEAASLRKYLQDEYALYGTFFCLLVGDHRTKMPIRKAYWENDETKFDNVNGDRYIPTDNYFSDLSEDGWSLKLDNAGIYRAEIAASFNPNIYVGRLLCNQPQEIYNYTKKLILYETNPGRGNSDYLDKTTLTVMYDGDPSYKKVKKEMDNLFTDVECLLDCKISNTKSKGYPSSKLMLEKLNESGYCSWIGHGEPSAVACSGDKDGGRIEWEYVKALTSYTYDEDRDGHKDPSKKIITTIKHICDDNGMDQLTNYDSPSVVNTLACNTCPFDVYHSDWGIYDVPHTVASSYTVGGPYGGVAYLGNTRFGYFYESSELEVLFLQQISKNPKIGMAEAVSKSVFNAISNPRRHVRHTHNLIGDPELEMWKGSPSNLDVTVSWNASNISVGGSDAGNSYVVVNNGEGNVRLKKITIPERNPVMYFDGGKMEAFGVFKTGYLPIVKLDCYNDELTDCDRRFVVRNAQIGCPEDSSVVIGQNADIDVRAVDSIAVGSGISIQSDGKLSLRCDKQVCLEGAEVASGGSLTVEGEEVTLSGGFSIKAGATLYITTN